MTSPAVPLPPPGADGVAYFVDLSSFSRRHYEAQKRSGDAHLAPLRNGEPGGLTRSILAWFVALLADRQPSYLAVCLDDPDPEYQANSIRRALLAAYKADRPAREAAFIAQETRIREIVGMHRVPILWAARYEADDILATLTRQAVAMGLRVIIVSRDKDLLQLVNDARGVAVWDGKSEMLTTEATVREEKRLGGVSAAQVADLLALAGDSSDGIPGVPGVGVGTASKLLLKHGTLSEVLRKAPIMEPSKVQEALVAHADDARLYRRLTGLAEDAPVLFDPWEARVGWDDDSVVAVNALNEALGLTYAARMAPYPKRAPSSEVQTRMLSLARHASDSEPLRPPEPPAAPKEAPPAPEAANPAAAPAPLATWQPSGKPRQLTLF